MKRCVRRAFQFPTLLRTTLTVALMTMLSSGGVAAEPIPGCSSVSDQACQIARRLGRGINLGDIFDPPNEGDWGQRMQPEYLDLAARHFRTVRLPVRWSNHAQADAGAKLDEAFAKRVDDSIDSLLSRGGYVIINMHHYSQLMGGTLLRGEFEVAPEVLEERFISIWRQLALRYRGRSNRLIFELLNEPSGSLSADRWNQLLREALSVVRQSNPDRLVMVSPVSWGHPKSLAQLRLPADKNLIVGVHTYDPFPFTHQGAPWIAAKFPAGQTCCSDEQKRQAIAPLELALQWSRATGYPVHLSEFGSYQATPMESRAAWARLMRDAAEARGMGWTYWGLVGGFGMWDSTRRQWHEPLRQALLD